MKMNKIICMLLTLTLLFSSNVYANDRADEDVYISGDVELMYKNINSITSNLSISGGEASCSGAYSMLKNVRSEIVMTLQRRPKSGNSAFSTYKEWSATNSGTGVFLLGRTKSVAKGYYYRVRVVIKVYTGNTVTEKALCYSATVTY